MFPRTKVARLLLSVALVMAASIGAALAGRRAYRPYTTDAPAYRQSGSQDARVVMVEYSDFECPACALAHTVVKQVTALYGKDLRLVFKHFPLERPHPWARPAAAAAECAGRQGAFWAYHDKLFESQREWVPAEEPARGAKQPRDWFIAYAKGLHLDPNSFSACLQDPSVEAAIAADMKEGNGILVSATPTFFISGRRFVGAKQLSSSGVIWIDKKLKKP